MNIKKLSRLIYESHLDDSFFPGNLLFAGARCGIVYILRSSEIAKSCQLK